MLRLVVLSYVLVISSCNWRDPRVRKLLGPNFEPLPSAHHRGSRVPMSLVRSMLSGNDGFRLHFDDASPTPDELNPKDGAFTGSLYNLWYHLAPPDLNTFPLGIKGVFGFESTTLSKCGVENSRFFKNCFKQLLAPRKPAGRERGPARKGQRHLPAVRPKAGLRPAGAAAHLHPALLRPQGQNKTLTMNTITH
ncbi:uncharacterized protein LOC142981675 isoform X1 [Anticarsia gemmatalis]|uniref:uncharacterized protein LOC142981675 isoform X1 n=1 Tax=Anticarsia gemmatalis TaxID=129554 RepID=UPI003F76DD52